MEQPATATSARQTQQISEHRSTVLVCVTLVIAVVGIYWQITGHDFINLDNEFYLTDNPMVNRGLTWEGVKWAFTATVVGTWHPITWLSFMLDCELYGLNPKGHHLHNLLFHALNSVLLFLALRALTSTANEISRDRGVSRRRQEPLQGEGEHPYGDPEVDFNLWTCALAAALFAVHPLRVESVAWAAERKDMLSGLFWWLCLLLYCRYVVSPGGTRYLALLTALVLGLMSKPMHMTLPFVLILLDYWPLRRFTWDNFRHGNRKRLWSAIVEKIPMFVICLGFAGFIATLGAVNEYVPLSIRLGNAPLSYVRYIGKIFWPVDLACLYPLALMLSWWKVWGAAVALLAITTLAFWQARTIPYFITGWLWFLGTLMPVIGIVQAGPQAMADRYTYISCVGMNIIVAWSVATVVRRRRWLKAAIVPAMGLVLLGLTALSFFQAALWRNSITIYRHTLAVTPDNPLIHNNLGVAFGNQGDIANAAQEYEEALRILPQYSSAHNNLGMIYVKIGQDREAVSHFIEAVRCRPNHVCRQPYLAAYLNLGAAYERLGEYEQAIAAYRGFLKSHPDWYAHFRLGMIYTCIFEPEEAIKELHQALLLKPDYPSAFYYLVINYLRTGNRNEAFEYHRKLSSLAPDMADELVLSEEIGAGETQK